jgi:hypothetical protein
LPAVDGKRCEHLRRKRDCGRRLLRQDRLDVRRSELRGSVERRRRVGLGHKRGLRRRLGGNEHLGRELEFRHVWPRLDWLWDNGRWQFSS